MEEIDMPDYLNTMPSLFWWELDEFIVMSCFIVVGNVMGKLWPFAMIALGAFVASKIKSWKSGELDGALQHILFAKGAIGLNRIYRNANHKDLWV